MEICSWIIYVNIIYPSNYLQFNAKQEITGIGWLHASKFNQPLHANVAVQKVFSLQLSF